MKKKMLDSEMFGHVPEGWPRVRVALGARLEHEEANGVAESWQASRFSDSDALRFVVEENVVTPADVEVWQARTGLDRPVARPNPAVAE